MKHIALEMISDAFPSNFKLELLGLGIERSSFCALLIAKSACIELLDVDAGRSSTPFGSFCLFLDAPSSPLVPWRSLLVAVGAETTRGEDPRSSLGQGFDARHCSSQAMMS